MKMAKTNKADKVAPSVQIARMGGAGTGGKANGRNCKQTGKDHMEDEGRGYRKLRCSWNSIELQLGRCSSV
ncbi:hypothetical protein BDA96_08G173400 [Sorghum bicolor]|uniref:Uncharacterized protein n=2 Tax=Sorghum bicolor TaxID=4558 RepID=A0A921QG63_SORBI|nr:hypothetical protein BDA96_08G173400 [Sorghum bicolor]KXG23903.1 hypothetical protein SORBI_3008G156800 [Sorghum bicolor]